MRISDWSSDVCSSDLLLSGLARCASCDGAMTLRTGKYGRYRYYTCSTCARQGKAACKGRSIPMDTLDDLRSEEHTSELQSLMRISYAVFCLKKKNITSTTNSHDH